VEFVEEGSWGFGRPIQQSEAPSIGSREASPSILDKGVVNLEKSRGLAGLCIDLISLPSRILVEKPLRYRAFYWELLGSEGDALVAEALFKLLVVRKRYCSVRVSYVVGRHSRLMAGLSAAITVAENGVFPEGKVEAIKVSLCSSSRVHSHCHQKPPFPIRQVRFLSHLQAFQVVRVEFNCSDCPNDSESRVARYQKVV
jgi:hypothetical protein